MHLSPFPSGSLVIAHRGASTEASENTLEAFDLAAEAGAEASELDVRLSADGVPVVVHDPVVELPSGGHRLVREMTVAELKEVSAPDEIPTLQEVLATARTGLDLEIKNTPGEPGFDSPGERTLLAALEALDRSGFSEPVLISSFNWLTIERSRALRPDIETGFLTVAGIDPAASLAYVRDHGHAWVLPQAEALYPDAESFVQRAHAAGVRVGTWTVDDPDRALELFRGGVDAVATNDPRSLVLARSSAENR